MAGDLPRSCGKPWRSAAAVAFWWSVTGAIRLCSPVHMPAA